MITGPCVLKGATKIGAYAKIENSTIIDSTVSSSAEIYSSRLRNSKIGVNAVVDHLDLNGKTVRANTYVNPSNPPQ